MFLKIDVFEKYNFFLIFPLFLFFVYFLRSLINERSHAKFSGLSNKVQSIIFWGSKNGFAASTDFSRKF